MAVTVSGTVTRSVKECNERDLPDCEMRISLSRSSEVPLRQQLAEQIIYLITTGELREGQELPSVRALARQVKVHYNTVSEAYQDLVQRHWVTRQRGSKLVVGAGPSSRQKQPSSLDDFINRTIERAKDMGYSLQELTERVRERILAQPPDHILIVEREDGLREILRKEVSDKLALPVEVCTPADFMKNPGLAVGAQVVAPNHFIEDLKAFVPHSRPCVPITYSSADRHIELIRSLEKPSIIAVASISEGFLRTARGVLAPAIKRRHTFQPCLLTKRSHVELREMDLVFCDSIAMSIVNGRKTIQYNLVSAECFEHLASIL